MPLSLCYEAYTMPREDRFPRSNVFWTIEPRRSVLLIHDMQAYFLRGLRDLPQGRTLVANAQLLRDWARQHDVPIAYTAQSGMDTTERGLLLDLWGPGMDPTAVDRDVIGELQPEEQDWRISKWRYSAFFDNDLHARIRAVRRDQIVICGVYAHLGITISAVDAYSRDIETFVVGDAIADFDLPRHNQALDYLVRSCARVVSTREVIA